MNPPGGANLAKEEKKNKDAYKFEHIIEKAELIKCIKNIKYYHEKVDFETSDKKWNYITIQFFDAKIITVTMCVYDCVISKQADTPYSIADALLCLFWNNTVNLAEKYKIIVPYNEKEHIFKYKDSAQVDLFVPIRYKHLEELMDFFMHPSIYSAATLNALCIGTKIFPDHILN
jgi:hypothetical protein